MPSNANLSPFAFLFPSWDAQVTRDYASSSLDPASLVKTSDDGNCERTYKTGRYYPYIAFLRV